MLLTTLIACAAARAGRPQTRRLEDVRAGYSMDSDTIRTAVTLWFSDRAAAEAKYGDISTWDTGRVTDMACLFNAIPGCVWYRSMDFIKFYHNDGADSFNGNISAWDTRAVTSMRSMFEEAELFNQPIGGWSVGTVTDMRDMFRKAEGFNQPLGDWDVSPRSMDGMFWGAASFNQALGWCVESNVDLSEAFDGTTCAAVSCGVVPGTCADQSAVAPEYCKLNATNGCAGVFYNFVEEQNSLSAVATAQYSAPAFGDLDGDGRADLLVGNGNGTLTFYRDTTSGFQHVVGASDPFAGIAVGGQSAPTLADLNGDRLLDLIIGSEFGGLAFYKNTGSAKSPEFTMVSDAVAPCGDDLLPLSPSECPANTELLRCNRVACGELCEGDGECGTNRSLNNCKGDGIFRRGPDVYRKRCTARPGPFESVDPILKSTAPAFADIDLDGDLDLLLGQEDGSTSYYKNVGSREAANYSRVTEVDNPFTDVAVSGWSHPVFLDLDGDGDFDLVIGNDVGALTYFRNVGSVSNPSFVRIGISDNPFAAVAVKTHAAPAFVLDDGVTSLVVGAAAGQLTVYRDEPKVIFRATTGPLRSIVALHGQPAFVDLTGDGVFDLVVGEVAGTLKYYRNEGSTSDPRFALIQGTESPFDGINVTANSAPAFADLTGDGAPDLILGEGAGRLFYYRNLGSRFEKVEGSESPFDGIEAQSGASTPALADIDDDGDFDLIHGEVDGRIIFFRNVGTPSAPSFERVEGAENPFSVVQGLISSRDNSFSSPALADIDNDGDDDLVVGFFYGMLYYYRNVGSRSQPIFEKIEGPESPLDGVDVRSLAAPTFVSLHNDGGLDLVVGQEFGTLAVFRSEGLQYCHMTLSDDPCSRKGNCIETLPGVATCKCSGSFSGDQCEECKPGFTGLDCQSCEPNTISTGGIPFVGDACTPCEPGSFAQSGQGECSPCAAGRYRGSDDAGCINCAEDYFSKEGAEVCTMCDPDTFTEPGDSVCRACPEGTARPQNQLKCEEPPRSRKKSNTKLRNQRRVLIVTLSVVGALLASLCCLSCAVRRSARRKRVLEHERSEIVQEQVTAARDQVQEFQAHFVTISGKRFMSFDKLYPQEELRDELIIYDSVADVRDASTRGEVFVFLSHQWLAWSEPDPQRIHVKAMQQAVRAVSTDTDTPLEKLRVWVDYISIPQRNRSVQKLAIASLPTFASVSDYFIVIAPNATHANACCPCDSRTYRRRAWCRAEIFCCWARTGTSDMFYNSNAGLKPLVVSDEILREALDVMGGEFTCCRLGHPDGCPCDREELMLPLLGLYADIYAERRGKYADAYAFIEPTKATIFPPTFEYVHRTANGDETTTTQVLFGDLVSAVEEIIDQSSARAARTLSKNLQPGTHAQRHRLLRFSDSSGSGPSGRGMSLTSLLTRSTKSVRVPSAEPPSTQPETDRRVSWRASAPTSDKSDIGGEV